MEVCVPETRTTTAPTDSPSISPTLAPSKEPTKFPTTAPSDDCACDAGDETAMSWKCGLHVYVCPGLDEICSNQGGSNGIYFRITDEQCDAMKQIQLGEKCVALPQYGINERKERKGLSNRVCYGEGHGHKTDSGGCDKCKNSKVPPFVTDAPTTSPSKSPSDAPSKSPTKTPTGAPSKGPTNTPTTAPSEEPTKTPTPFPTELPDPVPPVPDACICEAGEQSSAQSWKCGNDLYICPGMTQICKNSPSQNSLFYSITQEQCDAMKLVQLGEKCVALPQYDIVTNSQRKGLSHRVCYDGDGNPLKEDGQCEECQGYIDVPFEPTPAPAPGSSPEPSIDCTKLENLGYEFSAATNVNGCYPHITGLNAAAGPFSQSDDHVAMFIGGNFIEQQAAEVEGKVVTLGNLVVQANGAGNFVSVGAGTHIIPTPNTDCIVVGGDLKAYKNIQTYNQASWMTCNIVYKGGAVNKNRWKTNGNVRQDTSLDMSFYENMKYVLEKKSKYWKTLPSTGTFSDEWGQTNFECSNTNEIQVFNFMEEDRSLLDGPHTFWFGNACEGKTILINVHGTGAVNVNAATMFWNNRSGYGANGFPTCMTESILWNFPDAATVNIGNGKTSEFHGSILATGDLTFTTSGHSGRTIVLGDLTHSRGGSEFHSYQFNPPVALPDPDDICVIPEDISNAMVAPYPTEAPKTPAPTAALTKCLAIKQSGFLNQ